MKNYSDLFTQNGIFRVVSKEGFIYKGPSIQPQIPYGECLTSICKSKSFNYLKVKCTLERNSHYSLKFKYHEHLVREFSNHFIFEVFWSDHMSKQSLAFIFMINIDNSHSKISWYPAPYGDMPHKIWKTS